MKVVGKNLSPLCYLPCGNLVCYRKGNLVVMEDDCIIEEHPIFSDFKEKYLGRLKPIFRLLRLGIRSAIALDDHHIILSIGNSLYEYDLNSHCLSRGFYIGEGIRPLSLSKVEGLEGFDDCVLFGGYLSNFAKNPVHIYKRVGIDDWKVVYTFSQGTINHIHNVIPDKYRNCLWVFTGDFDEAAAIWKMTDNFQEVERVLCNDQKYRGCVCFPVKEGLLYATDAPFAQNYIYLMTMDYKICPVKEIDGSCIYGCQVGEKYVFSTTVEADGRDQTLMKLVFSRELGAGIKDNFAHLYMGNLDFGFSEFCRFKKDYYPFLFQFGVVRFPAGLNNTSSIYFQPVAVKTNDLDLLRCDF